jgi:hypothetical protein
VLLSAVLFVMFIPASANAQMPPETVNEQALRTGDKAPVASDASGAGSTNRIAKWLDGAGTLGDSILYESGGLVGLGTTTPTGNFHIFGGATNDVFAGMGFNLSSGPAMNFGYSGQSFGRGSGFFNVRPDGSATPPNPSLRFMTVNVERIIITNTGRVGIGTSNPGYLLDVNGTARVVGDLTIDGNISAKYQDLAEWVPSGGDLEAGTVVVINTDETNEVRASDRAYDTRVAGVVSPKPGIVLGVAGEGKSRVATMGRVRVKADARQAAIRVGDLLVTSGTEGTAMKSEVTTIAGIELHRPGTILGKALEPLADGQGEILVLLSLQ